MFINLFPHPRRRLKTRLNTLVSSGLVVQWPLFRGPVATASILPSLLRSGSGLAVCWTPPITGMLDDIRNPAFTEQELTVVLFLSLLLGVLSGCEIYSGVLFNAALCGEAVFSLEVVFVDFMLSLVWLGSPPSYTTHSRCG